MARSLKAPHIPRLISRRSLIGQAGLLAATGGGLWLLKERVLWPAPRPAFDPVIGGSGWLPLARDLLVPVVEAQVNGERVRALIDSGAQATVVDKRLAERLDLMDAFSVPMIAFGISGAPQTGRGANLQVTLGGLTLAGLRAAALDLSPLAALRGQGPPLGLVIGQDVLRTVILDLDLPRDRLSLQSADTHVPPPGAEDVPARSRGKELYTNVTVEGVALEVAIDTGLSAALALSEDLARSIGLLDPDRRVRRTQSVTFGGVSSGREVLADRLELGGRVLRQASVSVYERKPPSLLPAGLLGSGALRRTRAVLDLGQGRFLLAPTETPVRLQRFR